MEQIYECLCEYEENGGNRGVRRIVAWLRLHRNDAGSARKIYRICRERHLTIRSKHRLSGAANAGRQTQKSENLLDRSFAAQRPNGKFLSDITEIGCRGGQFCLAAVLDCFDGTGDSTWMAT